MDIALYSVLGIVAVFLLTLTPHGHRFRQRMMAKMYGRFLARHEVHVAERKKALFAGLSGTVLELGPGTGTNFAHLPDTVQRWVGIEPNPYMHEELREAGARRGVNAEFRRIAAEAMVVEDESIDVVLSTLVLCSVSNPDQVVRDIVRVLKPGGRYVFLEHVAAPQGSGLRLAQKLAKPFWRYFTDGCCPDRDIANVIRRGGFTNVSIEEFRIPKGVTPGVVSPHVAGIAIKSDAGL